MSGLPIAPVPTDAPGLVARAQLGCCSNSATARNRMIDDQHYDCSDDRQEQTGKIKTSYALPTKNVRGNETANKGTYNTQRNVEKKPLALPAYYLARDETCNEA
jgi:hypothetical protein